MRKFWKQLELEAGRMAVRRTEEGRLTVGAALRLLASEIDDVEDEVKDVEIRLPASGYLVYRLHAKGSREAIQGTLFPESAQGQP